MDQSPLGQLVFMVSLALASIAVGALGINAMLHLLNDDSQLTWKGWNWRQAPTQNQALLLVAVTLITGSSHRLLV